MYNHIAFVRWIKEHIPFWLKIILIRIIVFVEKLVYVYFHIGYKRYENGKKIFILLSTDYSNLGDHAMTYAHKKFIEEKFPEYEIIEISVGNTMKELYSIKKAIADTDIVTLKGGGNVGVEYFREELIRRFIIEYLSNTKIVMFPQTVFFPDTKFGKCEFKKTIRIYDSNKNFYCFFRDMISYKKMAPYLKRSFLTPDIVFSLGIIQYKKQQNKDSYALTCLRKDVEGIYSDNERKNVYKLLKENYDEVRCTDTIKDYKIEIKDREKELASIWKQIGNAEILVTDRLHGMIFAVLLGTPCVVLNTYNHKLLGQYEWVKDLNYVITSDINPENLRIAIAYLKGHSVRQIDSNKFKTLFDQIYSIML